MLQAIPLTNDHNQTFQITLQVNGVNVTFKFGVRWNAIAKYWVITLTDLASGLVLIDSLPLVCGDVPTSLDILRPYGSLRIGKAYLGSIIDEPSSEYPNETNMSDFQLLWDDNV